MGAGTWQRFPSFLPDGHRFLYHASGEAIPPPGVPCIVPVCCATLNEPRNCFVELLREHGGACSAFGRATLASDRGDARY
jgi:hypothetical protein